MKRYDPAYAGGRCPLGYEFVEGYFRPDRGTVESYCRKLKAKRSDPDKRAKRAKEKLDRKARDHASRMVFGNPDPIDQTGNIVVDDI